MIGESGWKLYNLFRVMRAMTVLRKMEKWMALNYYLFWYYAVLLLLST